MTDIISQSELEQLSNMELRSKFNAVAEELAHQQKHCDALVKTLRNIQTIIHRRRGFLGFNF
jgi:hypothetical protein